MIWTPDYITKHLAALTNDINEGEVVLFVGAGFSKMAGFPMWDELLEPLKKELEYPPSDLIKLAQEYEDKKGRNNLNRHLISELSSKKIVISKAHKIIASLPLHSILTLNFDEAIEETFKQYACGNFQKVLRNQDIAYLKPANKGGIPIIKINGCISDVDTIVISEKDFTKYIRKHKPIKTHIEDLLAKTTFLFLGTSFRDPIFGKFNSTVLNTFKKHKRPAYLLSLKATTKETIDLKGQGIEVIDLKITDFSHAESATTKFLENLYFAATGSTFEEHTPHSNLKKIMDERIGCGLSLEINPQHIDEDHKYLKIYRQDLLDYDSGDFFSIRRIKLKNVTEEITESMCYSESTENKCAFSDTSVVAFDYNTRKPLKVESFENPQKPMLTHAFKIYFPKPLNPDEEFELIYSIRLPDKLKKLSKEQEVMSISLARIKHGADFLEFNVCLNFKPKEFFVEYVNVNNRRFPFHSPELKLNKYTPKLWFEKEFNIAWSATPYKISWSCLAPKEKGYFINYKSI